MRCVSVGMYSGYMFVGVSVYACIYVPLPSVLQQDRRFARRPFDVVYYRKSIHAFQSAQIGPLSNVS